ncbi:MAG: hypothetical protein AUJ55_01110 [Proteobacteria bacterium CG1_02_64_396]|nr:MAG: hypothetical protein AUJ55_01110 [Proteobacteria bacterium CG1_02_64_396]
MSEPILVRYRLLGCPDEATALKKGESVAVGMTVGSWTDLPAAEQEAMRPYKGSAVASGMEAGGDAWVEVAYPAGNFPARLPALLTCVFGKLSLDARVQLADVTLPPTFAAGFPGPQFGIRGVRERAGISGRPLLMSIFKSGLGMSLEDFAQAFAEQADGGVDLIKDDEIVFDTRAFERIRAVAPIVEARARSGRPLIYAVNLGGPVEELTTRARCLVEAGAGALLLNVAAYGFDSLHSLAAAKLGVPLLAHPAVAGAITGIDRHLILGKFMRWCGADLVLFPGAYGSLAIPQSDAEAIKAALVSASKLHRRSWPVPSAGIHPGMVARLQADFGNDYVVNAGGAIHGHPLGVQGGVVAFRQAIARVSGGMELAGADEPELKAALEKWGIAE